MTFRSSYAIAALLLVTFSVSPAAAQESVDQNFSQAMQILDQDPSRIDQAIPLLKKSAEQGNAEAAYNLGVAFYKDNKISEALKWFKQASEAGNVRAKFNLATIYEDKKPEPALPVALTALYSAAAEGGVVQAMHRLGIIMITGQYGDKDAVNGLAWLFLAEKYEDDDVKDDLGQSLRMVTQEQKNLAKDAADKLRARLEQNPKFLNNMSL
jgi:TPR repeat protein